MKRAPNRTAPCDPRFGWKRGVEKCVRVTPSESGTSSKESQENAIILKEHQERVRERLREQDGLILDHGLGSGKTISAIAAAENYGGAVVVTPAALRENFKKELRRYQAKGQYDVMSYEEFVRDRPNLVGRMLIVDEAHRLANSSTKRTQAIADEASKASKRLLLTATPLQNRPSDASTLVNIAAGEKILPVGEADFRRKYLYRVGYLKGTFDNVFRGVPTYGSFKPKNLDEYRRKVSRYVDFYAPSQEGFPTVAKHTVNIPMSKAQARAQEAWLKEMPSDMKARIKEGRPPESGDISRLNTFMNATRQTANTGGAYGATEEDISPKVSAIADRIADSKGKALVYSNYIDSGVEPLEKALKQKNISSARLTGGMSDTVRAQIVRDYNADKFKTLVISSAGGEGLDLKRTEQIHVMEPHWNDEKINQVIGRGVRYKSHDGLPPERQHVDVYKYVSVFPEDYFLFWNRYKGLKTADEYLALMSERKMELNSAFLNSYRRRSDAKRRSPAKCDPDRGWEKGVGKCVRSKRASANPAKQKSPSSVPIKVIAAAAGLAGLSIGGYIAARERYRSQIPASAELALKRSLEIDPDTLPDFTGKEGILLAQPGFGGFLGKTQARGVEKIMERGFRDMAGDRYGTFMLPNEKFNVYMPDYVPEGWNPEDMRTYRMGPGGEAEVVLPATKKMLRTALVEGKNPQSIEATAYLLAMERKFRLQNPDREPVIKAAGYSAGGMILSESNMQLKYLGKSNVEMLFLGAPYYGLTDETPNITRVGSRNDPAMKVVPHGNTKYFDEVEYHAHYQDYPTVRSFISDWLRKGTSGERKDSLYRGDRRPPAKCDPKRGWERGPGGKCIRRRKASEASTATGKAIAASIENYEVNPSTGRPYKIRELRQVAREKGVVGYGSMSTGQMKSAMRLIDESPDEAARRNLVKTFSRDRSLSTKALTAGLGTIKGSSPAGKRLVREVKDVGTTFKRLEAVMKFASSSPVGWSVLGAAAFLGDTTIRQWNKVKDDYRKGIPESAEMAQERAKLVNVRPVTPDSPTGRYFRRSSERAKANDKRVGSENITFAIGGGRGYGSQELIDEIKTAGGAKDASEGDKWLSKNNFVPFDLKESGTATTRGGLDEATEMMGSFLRNRKRGRNQDSVDLAANLAAYALNYPDKKINIVAHGSGGLATKEALEILSKMEVRQGRKVVRGVDLVQKINVVLLGTPHFGYTEPVAPNTRTITSPNDPFSILPIAGKGLRPQYISSVKGHSPKDYLSDPSAREALREAFGYYRADSKAECESDHGWRDGPGKCVRETPAMRASDRIRTEIAVRDVESKIWSSPVEVMYAFDRRGNLIAAIKGAERAIRLSEAQRNALREKGEGGTMTHNHPGNGGSFSLADVRVACFARMREVRVVDQDYRYSIKKTGDKNLALADFEQLEKRFDSVKAKAMSDYRAAVTSGKLDRKTAQQEFTHGIWVQLSGDSGLGLEYRREARRAKNAAKQKV